MLSLTQPEIQFAMQAVAQAAQLALQMQAELVSPALVKDDRSPVTIADFTIQALVSALLEKAFPGDKLVAEETAQALRTASGKTTLSQVTHFTRLALPQAGEEQVCVWIELGAAQTGGRYWVLDPIDGTKGFLRAGQYAVALALVEDCQVKLGVLGCPRLQPACLVASGLGLGTWRAPLEALTGPAHGWPWEQFERCRVSDLEHPVQARLLRSYEAGHTNVGKIDRLAGLLGIQPEPRRLDSQAKYALLACGDGDALVRLTPFDNSGYKEKLWDIAAGALIVEEAGGCVSDLDGRALDYSTGRLLSNNRGILATNGRLHALFLKALETVQA